MNNVPDAVHIAAPVLAASLPDTDPAPAPDEGLTLPDDGSDLVSDDGGQDSGPVPPPLTGASGASYDIMLERTFTPYAGVVSTIEQVAPRDPELYALCRCAELLDELSPVSRERVIGYLTARSEA